MFRENSQEFEPIGDTPQDEKVRKNPYDNVTTRKRKLLPITSERTLKELPSLDTEISTDQTKKITDAKKNFDKIIKQVLPTPEKRFKIHYDEKDNITIYEEWMQMKKKRKRVQNLFRSLQSNPKSAFYTINRWNKLLIKKAKTSFYDKYKVFVNLHGQIEDKYFFKKENETLSLVTPFVDKKTNIGHSTLYSFHRPFEILHADIADIRFLAKYAVDPKYCLLLVDLLTSNIYAYPMKNRSLLAKQLWLFCKDIQSKRTGTMRKQTDLEFNHNKIKQLHEKFDVDMFHTKVEGEKAFAAEQKIRQFKKILLRSKWFEK